jgi:hypothetical protein
MNSEIIQDRTMQILLVLGAILVLTLALVLASILPATSTTAIALIWLLFIPFSYEILSEQRTYPLLDLPGIPTGSTWQPRPPRRRISPPPSARERAIKHMRSVLQRHGYANSAAKDPGLDLGATSPNGRNLVVKVIDGEAGVLACQDAMKAMLNTGAKEAIVLAPNGSTSTARRFVRKVRSRKGLRIRIWNDPEELEARIKQASASKEKE